MWSPRELPFDLLPPILARLADRRDWHACALVSKTFNRVATPLLYRKLDSRVLSKSTLSHPCTTLLARPELAQYVRHVTETRAVHRALLPDNPNITREALTALSLCTNIYSLTWADDTAYTTTVSPLLDLIAVLPSLPLRDLTIRTHSDLGEDVWRELTNLSGLKRVSIWCMEGPPRVLQGWSEHLGPTLTHLELGVSSFSLTPSSYLLMQLPLLQDLRLKGAPAAAIPTILSYLPNLHTLDTEYLQLSPNSAIRPPQTSHLPHPFPSLRRLTVRTTSADSMGPPRLFPWIHALVPNSCLRSLTLQVFTNSGHINIPTTFILELARVHGKTMQEFLVGESLMTLNDIECVCHKMLGLESLACAIACPDTESIAHVISSAAKLRSLKLQVHWLPSNDHNFHNPSYGRNGYRSYGSEGRFGHGYRISPKATIEDARSLMLRSEDSVLRTVGFGGIVYMGKWVLEYDDDGRSSRRFEVVEDVTQGSRSPRWNT
ncbi:hypothetical protein HGRIS_001934 [Hohenbuehelia grisea]|uniref:F-box domain-containing protein n=1 Tax=Hohenbuehelia grisea TaxID=104357 RepID=A0ABR3JIX0_9AGAR